MSDFFHDAWGIYIAVITMASIVACAALLKSMSTKRKAAAELIDTTGHTWDGDLTEWDNPLPRWWMWLFYMTIVFGLIYLALYPGLGTYQGLLGWSSNGQYREEAAQAAQAYKPIFDRYVEQDVTAVAADPEARQIGQRLFLTYCAQCHGSDAGGSRGFPSLRDRDWLYGGEPEAIRASIAHGRSGVMPPMEKALGGSQDAKDVAQYLFKLGGRTSDSLSAYRGKQKFETVCAGCHGADAKGNRAIGAPNLTDEVWLHGSSEAAIVETITKGRTSKMPAHEPILDAAKIHLLTAYVYGLSGGAERISAPQRDAGAVPAAAQH
ncbi:MAG: cytochrome-c oxidase, cbb3-type subunit III [Rhodospirillaceae bacterium]